ncbi:TRAP transporter small permease [Chelativorans sp. Marseille-P2723]|uniref:TRAP transporter small permease n=1 Tax=Chelativorans sp. Marseille-P2723 TaxID=2709133 RepID=UPI00156D78EA|nr:TRAP transporter small permease [Chelativorans sp. Marseille-P2723]
MIGSVWRSYDFVLKVIVVLLMASLATVGVLQIVFRYFVGSSLFWTEELSRYLLLWLVMFAAAIEVERGTHIAIRVLADLLPKVTQYWLERINLCLVLVFSLIIAIYGMRLALNTMSQQTATMPFQVGFFYLAVPIGGALMAINSMRSLYRIGRSRAGAASFETKGDRQCSS